MACAFVLPLSDPWRSRCWSLIHLNHAQAPIPLTINQYKDNLERNRPEILPITVGQSSTPIVGQIWTPVYRDVDFAQLVKLYGAPTG